MKKTTKLHERHRPTEYSDLVGQDVAVKRLRRIVDRDGFDGDCFWIVGPSGTGKTSLAWIIARRFADDLDRHRALRRESAGRMRCSISSAASRSGSRIAAASWSCFPQEVSTKVPAPPFDCRPADEPLCVCQGWLYHSLR